MKFRHPIIFFAVLVYTTITNAQPAKFTDIETADDHFKHGNYLSAIHGYQNGLRRDPDNKKARYRLGICFLNTRLNREEAVKLLEASSKESGVDDEVFFHLARAYHLTNRLDEAISTYVKYQHLKPKRAQEIERHIVQCENAVKMMRKPEPVVFQNLGKDVNSTEPDYNPFIDKDEMFLVFTSRRRENMGGKKIEIDGYRSSDIYQCVMDNNGNWSPAKNCGRGVNGNLDEQVVGLRSDGMEMYVYLDHIDKFGDIYVSTRRDPLSEFAKPKMLDAEIVNSKIETSGCLSEDGSLLIFARREDINSTSDLFMTRKLPNGKWGIPQRLPDIINSTYNEDVPYLSYDGQTLYFASDGHNTMGGYDLFKTSWNQKTNTFSPPQNLGYPINSTDDDKSICVTSDNRLAYVSAFRPSGFGDLDIYRVKFEATEQVSVIYTGNVYMNDTLASSQPKNFNVSINVTNTKTKDEYTFVPHHLTGRYVMALPAGNYKLTAVAKGYLRYAEDLTVSDMGKINMERRKDIIFKKMGGD